MQPLFKLRNSKGCLVSRLTLIDIPATSNGSDQTAHMRRLIKVLAGRTLLEISCRGSYMLFHEKTCFLGLHADYVQLSLLYSLHCSEHLENLSADGKRGKRFNKACNQCLLSVHAILQLLQKNLIDNAGIAFD